MGGGSTIFNGDYYEEYKPEPIGLIMVSGESIINSKPNYISPLPCEEKVLGRCDCMYQCNKYKKVDIIKIK
jgi:hypothetical protein